MNVSDEMLMAYVDGELDESARDRLESAMANDPVLAARIARQQALRARLQGAFDATLQESLPQRLLHAASATAAPAAHAVAPSPPRRWPVAASWFAMAASLLLGVLIGQRVLQAPDAAAQIVAGESAPVARGKLEQALTDQLAEQGAIDDVSVGISFLAGSGEFCRTFSLRADVVITGLACRAGPQWQIQMFDTAPPTIAASSGSMRQAAAELPDSVRQAVEARIAGEPLDRAGEAQARSDGWQRR
jgi:hypothetical protein